MIDTGSVEEKKLYEHIFNTDMGKELLNVMAKFCLTNIGKLETNPIKQAFEEGKRSFFIHILYTLNMSFEVFLNVFSKEALAEKYNLDKQLELQDKEYFTNN